MTVLMEICLVIAELDTLVREALISFLDDVQATGWQSRENEAINLFVFGHLLKFCRPDSFLHDPTQICIECVVPQVLVPEKRQRMQVRKDLVIWPRSRMTCWDESLQPTRHQTAVMEWKFKGLDRSFGTRFPEAADEDREWLRKFSEIAHGSGGYSVIVDNRLGAERLMCSRAYHGQIELEWLVV